MSILTRQIDKLVREAISQIVDKELKELKETTESLREMIHVHQTKLVNLESKVKRCGTSIDSLEKNSREDTNHLNTELRKLEEKLSKIATSWKALIL